MYLDTIRNLMITCNIQALLIEKINDLLKKEKPMLHSFLINCLLDDKCPITIIHESLVKFFPISKREIIRKFDLKHGSLFCEIQVLCHELKKRTSFNHLLFIIVNEVK